ncbi:MAG: hypothetical protein K2I07_01845 [Lachnospiraceae bacterium]|nr:hypothetical protein [Lachnospiraceae bacterium]
MNKLLKLDPKNTELLTQKQTVLKQAIEQTESKLNTLTQAQEEMKSAGKDINDEAYRELQREIEATKQKLQSYNAEQKKAKQQVDEVGGAFARTKQQIADNVKESEGVSKIKTAVKAVKQEIDGFKNSHPMIKKVADGFETVAKGAAKLTKTLAGGTVAALTATGKAAAEVANGGLKALGATINGTWKAFTAFATAALTAGAAVTKSAVEQYADYEQLVGGVETLFGAGGQSLREYAQSVGKTTLEAKEEYRNLMRAQEAVLQNASDAYKTAGLSANEYMETVTGFSAALISSLEGDTVAAAEKADMAITDMADNANKMGSDISTIQNAYQGFAKQNYTMLDNLKLGYGGTKEEMQRLLDDATRLSGIEYDISSYADIVDAIHVVQTEMGITGTTAKEASETITGSVNAAKSAWQNLMTGLADEEADLDKLIDDMVDSALTVVDNVLPRIMETVPRIVDAVPKLIKELSNSLAGIGKQLGGLTNKLLPPLQQAFFTLIRTVTSALPSMLPQVLDAANTLFGGLLQGLNETVPELMAMLPELIEEISQALTTYLPQLVSAGVSILVSLISGITNAIPSLITAIVDLIPVIVQAVTENLPLILTAGLNLLLALAQGIAQAIPQLVAMLPTVITSIIETINTLLPQIIDTGVQILLSLITGITESIPQLVAMLPDIISSIVTTITENLPQILTAGGDILFALISGLIEAIPQLIAAIPEIVTAIFTAFAETDWGEIGRNIIDGIGKGIKEAAGKLKDMLTGTVVGNVVGDLKEKLGIASPSKLMRDEVGKMIPAGLAIGVEQGMDKEEKRINEAMMRGVPTTIDGYIAAGGSRRGTTGDVTAPAAGGGFTQNVTINSPRELSPSETARQMRNTTRQMALRMA